MANFLSRSARMVGIFVGCHWGLLCITAHGAVESSGNPESADPADTVIGFELLWEAEKGICLYKISDEGYLQRVNQNSLDPLIVQKVVTSWQDRLSGSLSQGLTSAIGVGGAYYALESLGTVTVDKLMAEIRALQSLFNNSLLVDEIPQFFQRVQKSIDFLDNLRPGQETQVSKTLNDLSRDLRDSVLKRLHLLLDPERSVYVPADLFSTVMSEIYDVDIANVKKTVKNIRSVEDIRSGLGHLIGAEKAAVLFDNLQAPIGGMDMASFVSSDLDAGYLRVVRNALVFAIEGDESGGWNFSQVARFFNKAEKSSKRFAKGREAIEGLFGFMGGRSRWWIPLSEASLGQKLKFTKKNLGWLPASERALFEARFDRILDSKKSSGRGLMNLSDEISQLATDLNKKSILVGLEAGMVSYEDLGLQFIRLVTGRNLSGLGMVSVIQSSIPLEPPAADEIFIELGFSEDQLLGLKALANRRKLGTGATWESGAELLEFVFQVQKGNRSGNEFRYAEIFLNNVLKRHNGEGAEEVMKLLSDSFGLTFNPKQTKVSIGQIPQTPFLQYKSSPHALRSLSEAKTDPVTRVIKVPKKRYRSLMDLIGPGDGGTVEGFASGVRASIGRMKKMSYQVAARQLTNFFSDNQKMKKVLFHCKDIRCQVATGAAFATGVVVAMVHLARSKQLTSYELQDYLYSLDLEDLQKFMEWFATSEYAESSFRYECPIGAEAEKTLFGAVD